MHSLFLTAIMIALCSGRLAAELSFGSTPEWLAHQASLSFVGVPQRVVVSHLVGDRWLTTAQFRIDKPIKGPLSPGDLVTVTSIDSKGRTDQMDLKSAEKRKRHVLVLATIAENTFPETDGLYIFLPHLRSRPVFYADEPAKKVYTEEGKAIRDYSEVLKRIVAQSRKEAGLVRRHWPGKIIQTQREAEWGTDAYKELYGGSAVLIQGLEYREPKKNSPTSENKEGEEGGSGKPTTAVESQSENKEQPTPKSEDQ